MKVTRWGFVAAAIAALVLVPPAVGQGQRTNPLAWQYGGKFVTTCNQVTGKCTTSYVQGKIVTSYNLRKRPVHVSVFTDFYFMNYGALTSKLRITLKGSSAFTKKSDKCTNRRIKKNWACRVTVAYKAGSASSDKAVLTGVAAGGKPVTIALSGSRGPAAGTVYWVNRGTYVYDGSVKTIPSGAGSATTLAPNQSYPAAVVLDGTNVYWANEGTTQCPQSPYCHGGSMNSVPVGGGSYSTLVSDLNAPDSVAVDGTNVYWTDPEDQTVNQAPLAGGDTIVLASGQNGPRSVAVDGSNVYWVDTGDPNKANGVVQKVPIGGGTITPLASSQHVPAELVLDDTYLYWVSLGDGTVQKVPLGGGSATTLVTGQLPVALAVDATHIYWTNGSLKPYGGTVKAMPLAGGTVVTLARGQEYPTSVAVDGTYVYFITPGEFTDSGAVNVVPLGGGPVTALALGQLEPSALTLGP
jgi:hypothetical protein